MRIPKSARWSIPENMSFEPAVVKENIEQLERIARIGRLSSAGYAELFLLKKLEEFRQTGKITDASS